MQQPNYATRQFVIAGGADYQIERAGEFVTCLAATDAFQIAFDGGALSDFETGLTYRSPVGFSRLRLVNPGGSALTVKLGIGKGAIQDARLSISGQLSTSEEMPDTLTTGAPINCATGAATQIAAANPLRREIILVNEGAGAVRIVAPGGAAGAGLPLGAAQSVTLQTSGAVAIRNDTGAAVAVAWAELEATL